MENWRRFTNEAKKSPMGTITGEFEGGADTMNVRISSYRGKTLETEHFFGYKMKGGGYAITHKPSGRNIPAGRGWGTKYGHKFDGVYQAIQDLEAANIPGIELAVPPQETLDAIMDVFRIDNPYMTEQSEADLLRDLAAKAEEREEKEAEQEEESRRAAIEAKRERTEDDIESDK